MRGHNEDSRVYIENKNVYGLLEVANNPTCMDGERNIIAKHRVARQPSNSWRTTKKYVNAANTHECNTERLTWIGIVQ